MREEYHYLHFHMWRDWHPEIWSTLDETAIPFHRNGELRTFLCPNWVHYLLDHAGFSSTAIYQLIVLNTQFFILLFEAGGSYSFFTREITSVRCGLFCQDMQLWHAPNI